MRRIHRCFPPSNHLTYAWDGRQIVDVYEKREVSIKLRERCCEIVKLATESNL